MAIFSSLVKVLLTLLSPSDYPVILSSSLKSGSSLCWSIHSKALSVVPPYERVKNKAFSATIFENPISINCSTYAWFTWELIDYPSKFYTSSWWGCSISFNYYSNDSI